VALSSLTAGLSRSCGCLAREGVRARRKTDLPTAKGAGKGVFRKGGSREDGDRSYRIVAERALGKPLPPNACVHHHSDDQLVICQDNSYHRELHRRLRVLRAGGNPNLDAWCSKCQQPRPRTQFHVRRTASVSAPAGALATVCKACGIHVAKVRYHERAARTIRLEVADG
jgi:hypothetical protein